MTFLLAEQNTNSRAALRRLRLHPRERPHRDGRRGQGPARATRTSRSSTSAWAAATARASRTSRATSAASAGWPDMRRAAAPSEARTCPRLLTFERRVRRRANFHDTAARPAMPEADANGASSLRPPAGADRPRAGAAAPAVRRRPAGRRGCGARSPAATALATLPVTRKSELLERQKAQRAHPFGGFARSAGGLGQRRARRVFASRPAPSTNPRARATTTGAWPGRSTRRASGPATWCTTASATTSPPAGSMMETGAHALGCTVFPGGRGPDRAAAAGHGRPAPGRATSARRASCSILLEKADETGRDAWHQPDQGLGLRRGLPAQPARLAAPRGALQAYQAYATADLGLIAYETAAREGLVLDEGVIVEIVRPGTGDPVPEGEVGEVVVTTLQPRLPADPLRHRRPVGRAARHLAPRPHQHPHQGLDGPGRPDHQGARHVRAPRAGGRGAAPSPGDGCARGWWSSGEMANDHMTLQVRSRRRRRRGPGRPAGRRRCAS